eukprot:6067647-Pleurochrysis_carterae.AAC.1
MLNPTVASGGVGRRSLPAPPSAHVGATHPPARQVALALPPHTPSAPAALSDHVPPLPVRSSTPRVCHAPPRGPSAPAGAIGFQGPRFYNRWLDCTLRAGVQIPTMSSAPSVRPTRGPRACARGSIPRVPSCGLMPPAARTHGWAPPCATAT